MRAEKRKQGSPVMIRLTEEQRAAIKGEGGLDAETLDLYMEELEERIAPRLSSTPLMLPGRLTIKVLPRDPAIARERAAIGV